LSCIRIHGDGVHPVVAWDGRVQRLWPVGLTAKAIEEWVDHLVGSQVELVMMDATTAYWKPFFYLLEVRGLRVGLVNAQDLRNGPGVPKTGKLDTVWLSKPAERGMLRRSLVSPKPTRQFATLPG
jgi:transposase